MEQIPTGSEQRPSLKLAKSWQGTKPVIIWQVSPWGAQKGQFPKKLYLILECQQAKRGVYLRTQKPAQIKLGGGISALLRKHIPAGTVREVLVHKTDKHIWIPVYQAGNSMPEWYLMLSNSKPPELSLISKDGTTLFRYGQKGTFTKRKESEHPLPNDCERDNYESILDSLLAECALDQSEGDHEVEEKKKEDEEPSSDAASDLQREAKQKLARKIKTVKKSYEKQSKGVPSQQELDLLSKKANLLQSYAYLVKPEQTILELEPALTGLDDPLEIELNPEWTTGKNVEEYFVLLKKRKKSVELGSKMLEKISKELASMEQDLEKVKSLAVEDIEIASILKKYKIEVQGQSQKGPSSANKGGESLPYKLFKGLNKAEYLVGKGPSENDLLTKKAKSNDYWVHLIGGGGSHIVVPKRSLGKEGLSPEVKREAAILAIHFSKVRQDRSGEVYVTQRRHLRKQKGLPVGLWLVDQSETFFIKYSEKDLKQILDRS